MKKDRPDYIKCCLSGTYKPDTSNPNGPAKSELITWCGREIYGMEWCFVDPTHAILNARNKGCTRLCPECKQAIIKVLEEEGKYE